MKSQEVRSKFLKFFEDKGHKIVSSSPMVSKEDPSLMFINSEWLLLKIILLVTHSHYVIELLIPQNV